MMYSVIGMQKILKSILSIFESIIRLKIFDTFGKLRFKHFCKVIVDW